MGTNSSPVSLRQHLASLPEDCVIIGFLLNDSNICYYECPSSYAVKCSQERMETNLRTMVEQTKAVEALPVFWAPPPVPNWPDNFKSEKNFEIQMELLRRYLAVLKRIAAESQVPLADFWNSPTRSRSTRVAISIALMGTIPMRILNPSWQKVL